MFGFCFSLKITRKARILPSRFCHQSWSPLYESHYSLVTFVLACIYLNLVQTHSFDRQPPYLLLYCLVGNSGDCAENDSGFGLHIFYQLADLLRVNSVQGQVGDRPGIAHLHRLFIKRRKKIIKILASAHCCCMATSGKMQRDTCPVIHIVTSQPRLLQGILLLKLTTVAEQGVGQRHKSLPAAWEEFKTDEDQVLNWGPFLQALFHIFVDKYSPLHRVEQLFLPVPTQMKTLEPLQSQNKASRWGGRRSTGSPTWFARRFLQPVSMSRVVSISTICKQ